MDRVSQPPMPGRLHDPRLARIAISFGARLFVASLAVRGSFLGRRVLIDPARCLSVYEGRRAPQSDLLGCLHRGTMFQNRGQLRCRAPPFRNRRGRYNTAPV
jgi:hypothetical protein